MPKFFYFCAHEQFHPEELVRQAKLAEEVGFDGVMVSDHFHPWVDDVGRGGFSWATLGAIAEATKRITLMTGVVSPLFRTHPALVAQAASTIDRISGGRFELGLGTGEALNEGPLGYPFPKYNERKMRLKEGVEIIRRLFGGEKLTYEGKYYKTDRAKLYSPPVKEIHIWIAAKIPESIELAAKIGDGLITSVRDPSKTKKEILDLARNFNPRIKILTVRWSVFAKSGDEAWQAIQPWRGLRVPGRLQAIDPEELRKKADELGRDEILKNFPVASSIRDFINLYAPLVTELKSDVITIQTTSLDQEKTIKMLGEKVLPALHRLGG